MTQSASIQDWYTKAVYLEYLNTCWPQRTKPLCSDTHLEVSYDEESGMSFIALDIATKQCMTIDPDGLVERYNLSKVA